MPISLHTLTRQQAPKRQEAQDTVPQEPFKGLDQQGRYRQAAEAATDIGADDDYRAPMRKRDGWGLLVLFVGCLVIWGLVLRVGGVL